MIQAEDFAASVLEKGYNFWTGVPCSFLGPLINYAAQSQDLLYIGASSEGEAVGIAIGAHLAGRKTVVLCQNSGLGNMVNPLTSLNHPFRIPTLLIISHRGAPGFKDEPEHELMGEITEDMLKILRIPWKMFPEQAEDIGNMLGEADKYMTRENLPYALIMKKGSVGTYALAKKTTCKSYSKVVPKGRFTVANDRRIVRNDAIKLIRKYLVNDELIIGTTGKVSRELFAHGHCSNQIYVIGGMGCASAIGLGLSLCQRRRKVVVLDGDGAVLMKMGTLATIGHYHPKNLIHIILDNEAHESTGGQPTVSGCIDFAQIASACSYNAIFRCDTELGLKKRLKTALNEEGPVMIHVKTSSVSYPNVGRPTLSPVQMKEQFMKCVAQ